MFQKVNNEGCPHGCNSQGNILFQGKWMPCPIHGDLNIKSTQQALSGSQGSFEFNCKALSIPYEIQEAFKTPLGIPSLESIKISATTNNTAQSSLDYVMSQLSKLEESLSKGTPLLESSYFYLGSWVNLVPFVYSLQLEAFDAGMSQVPVLAVSDIYALKVLDSLTSLNPLGDTFEGTVERLESQLQECCNSVGQRGLDILKYTRTSFSDTLKAPVLFLLDNSSTTKEEIVLLSSVLRYRGSRGLPTYIFSSCFPDKLRQAYLIDTTYVERLSKVSPYVVSLKGNYAVSAKAGYYSSPGPLNL